MDNSEKQPSDEASIPVISGETLEALKSQYTNNNGDGQAWGERLTEMQNKVMATNPNLVAFIEMQVGKYPSELHQPMFEVLVGTLVLLERQAGADALNASFSSTEPEK
ncbi:MAG: hypothetical protein WCJ86_00180 [Candidatus Saccharibacteria bacterium]